MPSKITDNNSKTLSLTHKVHSKAISKDMVMRRTLRTQTESNLMYKRKMTLKKQLQELAKKSGLQCLLVVHDPLKGFVTQFKSQESFDLDTLV